MMEAPSPDALSQLLMRSISLSENGLAILNAENRYIFHNAAFANMFGFKDRSMVGRSRDEMMTWMFENRSGANIEWETLDAWLDYVHVRFRSAPFRSFEVDLVDGRWLLISEQVHPTGEVVMLCSDITSQKKIELELKEARVHLERLAFTDELTGVANRRYFISQLSQEVARSHRYRHPLCLAMLDLDHFKQVNDRFGHPAGDEVLKHFTAFLKSRLRITDLVGRVGGEEFGVLMPATGLDSALSVLRRIGVALASERLDSVAPGFAYTFSGGVVRLPDEEIADCNWMLASSDRALYQAKATGRNKLVPYEAVSNLDSA